MLLLGIFLSFVTDKQGVLLGLWLIGLSLLVTATRLFYKQPRSHFLLFALSLTLAFCFYLYWDYSLCTHIIKTVRGNYPDRGWSSLRFFLQIDLFSYTTGLWTGFKLVILQIQMAFRNILDGNLLSWTITVVSYILLVLLSIKGATDNSASIDNNSKQSFMDIMFVNDNTCNRLNFLCIHDYASFLASQSNCLA